MNDCKYERLENQTHSVEWVQKKGGGFVGGYGRHEIGASSGILRGDGGEVNWLLRDSLVVEDRQREGVDAGAP